MKRSILHCDMNNFYASVERLYDPTLKNKPIAVCGDVELRHGIILAKSEEAKKYGVLTGDTLWQAKAKCPDLITIPPHFDRYVKYSRLAKEIYLQYTDLVEPFGLDECWLDVTASHLAFGNGVQIGQIIRGRIKEELGLTISVGVSFNKTFSKLGSDLKKPDALTEISLQNFQTSIWPLPVESLLGVGRKTKEIFSRFGIDTIGDLAHANPDFLRLKLGKVGIDLQKKAAGEDLSPVIPASLAPPVKSISRGCTTAKDLQTEDEVWLLILSLAREIGEKLRFHKLRAGGVAIFCKTGRFVTHSLQKSLSSPTFCNMTLAKEAFSLFQSRYSFREPLRSLTVSAIHLLDEKTAVQLSFLSESSPHTENLDKAMDRICRRWGKNAVFNASLLSQDLPDTKDYIPFHGTAPLPLS